MARNKYPGRCYCCGQWTPPGYSHFERYKGHWRIKCVKCASGRVLTDKDPGVIWAQKALRRPAMNRQERRMREHYQMDDLYPERYKLKEKGINVEKWQEEVLRDDP